MNNGLSFEANDHPLKDVLFSNWKFRIPRYQRPYTWNEDQLSDFWLDLTADESSYFFGSFILNREYEKKSGYVEIVDGQQRMMTVTILMAVIRDILIERNIDSTLANVIQRHDIAHEDRSGDESYRIKCSDSARKYFTDNIQLTDNQISESTPITSEEKQIKKNYEFFHNKIIQEIEKCNNSYARKAYLVNLREKVSELIVIKIEIESEEAAYEIFETTNARGVDLSIADLLKNLIFKNIRSKGDRDLAKEIWESIVKNIQETNIEMKRFIRYYWISRHQSVTDKNLFRNIKKNTSNWQILLDDLKNASKDYANLINGNIDDWNHIKHKNRSYKAFEAIRCMNVSQCYVLILSILRNYKKLGTDPTRIFELIEKFTFVYSTVCKQPANKVEKLYSKYARDLEKIVCNDPTKRIPGNVNRLFSKLEDDLVNEFPSYSLFEERFAKVSYANSWQKRTLVKYILSKLNNHGKTGEYRIDFDNVNIEHVLPQSPKEWGLSSIEIKPYVNLLGNLTLVSKTFNSAMGNKALKDKIDALDDSEITITQDLVKKIRENSLIWNDEMIKIRQMEICRVAYNEVWNIK